MRRVPWVGDTIVEHVSLPAIDMAAVTELNRLDSSLLAQITKIFLAETPERVSQTRDAIARQDSAQTTEHAHYLKSSCDALGAHSLRRVCDQIELAAIDDRLDDAAALLEQLEHESQRACAELRALAQSTPS